MYILIVINKNDTNYVVRVVASGGDTVEITDSERLVINGNTVIENKIYASQHLCIQFYASHIATTQKHIMQFGKITLNSLFFI